jgi:hypothetical protein
MWRFDHRRGLHGRGSSLLHLFRFCGRFSADTEVRPNFVCEVVVERTGVRLLVRNSRLGQVLDNHVALHFQFACQFVDPNLPHASVSFSLTTAQALGVSILPAGSIEALAALIVFLHLPLQAIRAHPDPWGSTSPEDSTY